MRFKREKAKREVPAQVAIVNAGLRASTPREQAMAEIYAQAHDIAMKRFERLVGTAQAADALNDAAEELFEKWYTLQPEQKTVGAFLTAVEYRVLDELRKQLNSRDIDVDDFADADTVGEALEVPDVGIAHQGQELEQIIDPVVRKMPPMRQRVWMMHREGYSNREIGVALGIHETGAGRHLDRARADLQRRVKRAGWEITATTARALPRRVGEASND